MSQTRKIARRLSGWPPKPTERPNFEELDRAYWQDKHRWGHVVTEANPTGFEPDCYLCREAIA